MVIGIVIDKLYPGKIGGAEQYIRNVIDIFGSKEDVKVILFLNEYAMDSFKTIESKGACRECVPEHLNDAEKYYEYYIAKYNIQILFCPLFYVPYEHCSVPMVASILDIQYEYYPEYFTPELLQYRREETKKAVDYSSAIITISEFSKDTIVEKLKVDREKIFVTYLNSDSSFDKKLDKEENIKIQGMLPDDYIFYPANGWAHKNHKRLIDAYILLKEKYHTRCKLVLTGNAFNDANGLQEYINEKGLENDVITLGYIEQKDMPYVFYNASILVFPSLFEGFGIPLVEAMRVGTPIACSNCGSIPEIVRDAAVIFEADDPTDMAEKIHLLEENNDICQELIRKGTERAAFFSWEKCAEQTLEVLKKQIIKRPQDNQIKYQMPQLTLLVPVYFGMDGLKDLLDSIEKQEYENKKVVIFTERKDFHLRIYNWTKKYSMKIEVVSQNSLSNVVDKKINEDENGIIGVLQVGQIFEDINILDDIVLEFIQTQRNICWVKPKREGFWGLLLHNNYTSSTYQRFINFDQISCSLIFVSKDKRATLKEIPYWFNGHYQEIIFGDAINKNIEQSCIKDTMITDNSKLVINKRKDYIKSLCYLWKKNQYIPLSIVDRKNIIQVWMLHNLTHSNNDIQKYYKQIKNEGIEFDKIALDGWMSNICELEIELKETKNLLIIEGENNVLQQEAVLNIMIDNEIILCNNVIDSGRFTVKVNIPSKIKKGKHLLYLKMQKTFSYYKQTKNDIRALSIQITKISINEVIIWEQ